MLKAYRKLKIQHKFTLVIVLAVLLPFAILGFAFSDNLYNMIVSETIKDAQETSANTIPEITGVVDNITAISTEIAATNYYEDIFYSSSDTPLDDLANSFSATMFNFKINELKEQGINVRIYMGIPEHSSFFSCQSSQDIFLPVSDIQGTYWHGIFQGTKCPSLFAPANYLSSHEIESLGDNAYITYMTMSYDGNSYPCYMAIYYSGDQFQEILTRNMTFKNGVSYIINDREEIVSTTNEALSSTYRLSYTDINNSLMSSNSFISREVMGDTIYVAFHYISAPGWFIVTVIPEAPLLTEAQSVIQQFILIVLVCVAFAMGVALLQSHSITSRISSVINQMATVKDGPPLPMDNKSKSEDEVGDLIDTYNYMAEEMQKLIIAEQRAAENLRIAEFNALQAQINPHFLYNTMDMINWLARDGQTEQVSDVVQRLSRFYKLTLSKKNTMNSIADEIEHVSLYMEIQNMRHSNSIEFVVDMPDELTQFSIPKLTLQPIIENSILHGIWEKDTKSGTIIITGWEEDDDIVILISDDGVGMSPEILANILSDRPMAPSKGSNVAIINTHHRLQILYGPKYGLSYASTLGQGTEVTLRIPELIG